jgi:GTP-binding protein EngB required for normal cell division
MSAPLRAADALIARIALLDQIVAQGDRLPASLNARATDVASTARARLGHGTRHTVVALAGGTGSGKSSLFNALAGETIANVGVRRPTTSVTQAAVYGDGAESLLDWLHVDQRSRMTSAELEGLVLLDLPDHDSTAAAHVAEVDRLVEVVDAFCWVVDPQKYADAALHEGYLRAFAGHAAVTMVVLNQIDRLSPEDRQACLAHLSTLLQADGFVGVRVLPVSASTGEGVAALQRELTARVAERRAVVARISADLDWLATDLAAACGDQTPSRTPELSRANVIDAAVAAASGADVEAAVDASFRHRASLAVGWPPLRWLRNLKPDPLKRLGLDHVRPTAPGPVRRTAIGTNTLGVAQLEAAGRDLARGVSAGLAPTWNDRLTSQVTVSVKDLPDSLDAAVGALDLPMSPPRWFTVVGLIQRLVSVAMLTGLLWLAVIAVMAWLKIPAFALPKWRGWPIPTLLAVGGAAAGLLIAFLGRRLANIGGRRRAGKTRKELRRAVANVIDTRVISPLDTELTSLANLGSLVRKLA